MEGDVTEVRDPRGRRHAGEAARAGGGPRGSRARRRDGVAPDGRRCALLLQTSSRSSCSTSTCRHGRLRDGRADPPAAELASTPRSSSSRLSATRRTPRAATRSARWTTSWRRSSPRSCGRRSASSSSCSARRDEIRRAGRVARATAAQLQRLTEASLAINSALSLGRDAAGRRGRRARHRRRPPGGRHRGARPEVDTPRTPPSRCLRNEANGEIAVLRDRQALVRSSRDERLRAAAGAPPSAPRMRRLVRRRTRLAPSRLAGRAADGRDGRPIGLLHLSTSVDGDFTGTTKPSSRSSRRWRRSRSRTRSTPRRARRTG